jgi:uncharacterized protein (DUF58 family)
LTDAHRSQQNLNQAAALRADAESLGASLPPLLVAAEQLASVVGFGVHGRRKAGSGETFWQFRRYGVGDPANTIDWRQSAKSQHLFVREREWEAAEAVWFWCDTSPGMHFASAPNLHTKIDRAKLLALALASLLIRGGERVALLGKDRIPASGRAALTRMVRGLTEDAPAVDAMPPDLPIGKSAQLVWLGDFLSPLPDVEAAIRRLAGRGLKGHLVHLIDPAEEDFPYTGRTRFEWNSATRYEIFGRAENVRVDYQRRFRAQGEAVSAYARRLGWNLLTHRTDQRPENALIALYADLEGTPDFQPRAQSGVR